ncbi:MAG: lipopolysaccharide biosynthesis protein [Candidatus Contendobacter sp.]|nr:lipopolysaccharide biosynthesis protein [Candidatus Contendobacter sp.]
MTLAGAGARLLSFVTVPVLSHLLGPGPYGVAALVGTLVSLGSMLALVGIDMAYARYYLQEDIAHRAAVERFCWRFAGVGALSMAVVVGWGWYGWGQRWLPDEYRMVAWYSFPAIVLSVAVVMATTRIRLAGNYRKLATTLIVAALVSMAINLGVALTWRADVWALLLGVLGASLTTLALLGLPAPSALLTRSNLPAETKRAIVSLGLAGSVTAPTYWVISSADRWFLAEYTNETTIGIYSMASSVALLGLMLNSGLTLTWFPEASRLYGEHSTAALAPLGRLWERLVVGLAVVWVAVAAAGGDVLRLLAAPQFHLGAVYIPWLAGGIFFYGLAGLANTAFFLESRMRYVAYFWVGGAVLSLCLNWALVPSFGSYGAAIAQCVSYGLIAVGILVASRKMLLIPVNWRRLGLCLLLALGVGISMSPAWIENPLLSLLGKFPVGVLVAVFLIWMIAPDWFMRGVTKVRQVVAMPGNA